MNFVYRRFVKRLLIINALSILSVIVVSYVVMGIVKENYNDNEILQDYENVLYGSALKDGAEIKFDIVKGKKPDVIALGSSRVMQFRADFFKNRSFYTMGGLSSSIDELDYTWQKVKSMYIPKVVIVGVDSWWLNPNMKQSNRYMNQVNNGKYKEIAELYRNKKIWQQLLHADEIKSIDPLSSRKNIGLDAAVNGNGYRLSDGSRQYGKIINDKPDNETRFKSTYERMNKGDINDCFVWCDTVSNVELNKLHSVLKDIKESGATLIVFLPPFPHEVYDYMDKNLHFHSFLHDYMYGTGKICNDLEIPFYNFCDLSATGATDDETIDGFHGSEMAYARITMLIGKQESLSKYVESDKLRLAINNPLDSMQAISAER